MTALDLTVGVTYQRGQQERTIVEVTDTMIHYQNKTDKKLGMMHTCCQHEFANWALKAAKKGENGEFVAPPDRLTVAQKRARYLAPSRLYFKRRFEKQHKEFSFEDWAYHGLHWADWEYIVRLVCHSFGVSTVDQLEENQIELANELATNLVAFIFKANVDMLKSKEGTND
jgi:hypothetical protein